MAVLGLVVFVVAVVVRRRAVVAVVGLLVAAFVTTVVVVAGKTIAPFNALAVTGFVTLPSERVVVTGVTVAAAVVLVGVIVVALGALPPSCAGVGVPTPVAAGDGTIADAVVGVSAPRPPAV